MTSTSKAGKWYLIQNPILFQGVGKLRDYFEGWYFKVVDPAQDLAVAFIPGIAKDRLSGSHCFIQILDGVACKSYYHAYELDAFKAAPRELELKVGPHFFSEKRIHVQTEDIQADLTFEGWNKLPKRWLRPGIMGWYSYVPFMQCYHGVGSMHHRIQGTLRIGNRSWVLKNASGYVEKDWGRSFPKSWIWTQCNTFEGKPGLSVFASVAHIPWLGSYFIGFLALIHFENRTIILATYNGAKKNVELLEDGVNLQFKRGNQHLCIQVKQAPGADLRSPITGEMRGKVNESLQAKMDVSFWNGSTLVVQDQGSYSGLEVAGPVEILCDPDTEKWN